MKTTCLRKWDVTVWLPGDLSKSRMAISSADQRGAGKRRGAWDKPQTTQIITSPWNPHIQHHSREDSLAAMHDSLTMSESAFNEVLGIPAGIFPTRTAPGHYKQYIPPNNCSPWRKKKNSKKIITSQVRDVVVLLSWKFCKSWGGNTNIWGMFSR